MAAVRLMQTVFLDLDGTLTDPAEGIVTSVLYALERTGVAAPSFEQLTWVIGPPLIESFEKLGVPDPVEALGFYRDRFSDKGLFENVPFPGVDQVLAELALRYRLCLATAKPIAFAERITRHFGLDRHLFAQFGPELDGTRNDKGELLAHALREIGERAVACVMVGDRHHDIDAAKAVGMRSIAVAWGYGNPTEHAGADLICETLADLPAAIATLMDGA
ncbi:MAG: HAD hydrolase-like protein [Pseudomonadota bacterium]|nr:HAD hydrolase-like protein [Pseudomonadota bacterium]